MLHHAACRAEQERHFSKAPDICAQTQMCTDVMLMMAELDRVGKNPLDLEQHVSKKSLMQWRSDRASHRQPGAMTPSPPSRLDHSL